MTYTKPYRLKAGDTVAIISPAWGGPNVFPHVYENGIRTLQNWGLSIKEMPGVRMGPAYLRANPKMRAQ